MVVGRTSQRPSRGIASTSAIGGDTWAAGLVVLRAEVSESVLMNK